MDWSDIQSGVKFPACLWAMLEVQPPC